MRTSSKSARPEKKKKCLDFEEASEIVSYSVSRLGKHYPNDLSVNLIQLGCVALPQREIFRANVQAGVRGQGCDIHKHDIPIDEHATLYDIIKAISDNSFYTPNI